MEHNRYQQNNPLFVVGMISLLACLSLLAFSLYILPYLMWDLTYSVPGFVLKLREFIRTTYDTAEARASVIVFLMFLIPALLSGYLSYVTSNRIERDAFTEKPAETNKESTVKKDLGETARFTMQTIGLIILMISGLVLLEWLLTT